MPHRALNITPYEGWIGKPGCLNHARVFGCVCYALRPLLERSDKYSPISDAYLFLGFDDKSSFDTVVLYKPSTRRLSYRTWSDVQFNENMRAVDLLGSAPLLDAPAHLYSKHSSHFWEDSLTDSSSLVSSSSSKGYGVESSSSDSEVSAADNTDDAPNANERQPQQNEEEARQVRIRREARRAEIDEQNIVNRPRRPDQRPRIPPNAVQALFQPQQPITVFALVESKEVLNYEPRKRTQRQKEKLLAKIKQAKREMKPLTFRDLENTPDKQDYLNAIDKELDAMTERNVLKVVDRTETKGVREIGKLLWVLTKKRDGRYKARLVYNGRDQKFKITSSYSSPTLSQQALVAALTVASYKGWDFKSMDVTSAFLYADLPADFTQKFPKVILIGKTERIKFLQSRRIYMDCAKDLSSGGDM